MRTIFLSVLTAMTAFFSAHFALGAASENLNSFLRQEAEAYLEAYMARDYETCLRMMGGSIVQALGGKIRVLDHFRMTEETLQRHHFTLESMTVDEPRPVVKHGAAQQFVVIPERHIFIAGDGNKYILNSYILAVSEDNGKTWNMFEGNWRVSEHIKTHDLLLFDKLNLPVRKIYLADDPKIMMVEKGGSFIMPPETIKYKQSLHRRGYLPYSPPKPAGTY